MAIWNLLLPLAALAGQADLKPLATTGLEQKYVVEGLIVAAYRVQSPATRTLLLSRTGSFRSADEDSQSARLYATLFVDRGDEHEQIWRIQDAVLDCPFDITADFTTAAASVSDADGDGELEFWVSYRTSCRSDVSPSTLKLIAYEGKQKYALRGRSRLVLGDSAEGGDYQADANLQQAPKLLQHAEQLWRAVQDESF